MRLHNIDLTLPENPTTSHVLRQQELVARIREWESHNKTCQCKSCLWVREQLIIEARGYYARVSPSSEFVYLDAQEAKR
jgi:hypothetical protein